jgi:hypothetical protein
MVRHKETSPFLSFQSVKVSRKGWIGTDHGQPDFGPNFSSPIIDGFVFIKFLINLTEKIHQEHGRGPHWKGDGRNGDAPHAESVYKHFFVSLSKANDRFDLVIGQDKATFAPLN